MLYFVWQSQFLHTGQKPRKPSGGISRLRGRIPVPLKIAEAETFESYVKQFPSTFQSIAIDLWINLTQTFMHMIFKTIFFTYTSMR